MEKRGFKGSGLPIEKVLSLQFNIFEGYRGDYRGESVQIKPSGTRALRERVSEARSAERGSDQEEGHGRPAIPSGERRAPAEGRAA